MEKYYVVYASPRHDAEWTEVIECDSREAFEEYYKRMVHVHLGSTIKWEEPLTEYGTGRFLGYTTIAEDLSTVDWYLMV